MKRLSMPTWGENERPMLSVDKVVTGYAKTRVLHEVSLSFGPGEIVGLLGANGAGKSTLLRAIAGVIPLWSGHIALDGTDLSKKSIWARVRHGCAHVQEGRHIFPGLTVQQNIEVAVAAAKTPELWEWFNELFPILHQRRQQLAGTLSGGEQQMLAIARALATSPRYLLIDEMSAGLAPLVVHALTDAIEQIAKQGVGVLLVEQSPDYIIHTVSRVTLLERGMVIDSGTLTEVGGRDRLARMYLGAL
jgi:branched-chain amino acid transport system ATP-binding protein